MKRKADIDHRWVAWSEEDQVYVGRCPDLFLGGVHGDDPLTVAKELQQVIDEWDEHHDALHEPLPPARVRPMIEVAWASAGESRGGRLRPPDPDVRQSEQCGDAVRWNQCQQIYDCGNSAPCQIANMTLKEIIHEAEEG